MRIATDTDTCSHLVVWLMGCDLGCPSLALESWRNPRELLVLSLHWILKKWLSQQ